MNKKLQWKKFYHRYFEDYEEMMMPNEKGRGGHIHYTYVGFYYSAGLSLAQKVLRALSYIILYLAAAALVIIAAAQPVAVNSYWLNGLATGAALIFLLLFLMHLLFCIFEKNRLTVYGYKSGHLKVIKLSLYTAYILVVTAALMAASALAYGSPDLMTELLCAAAYLAAAILMMMINRAELRVNYQQMCNPDGKVTIDEEGRYK